MTVKNLVNEIVSQYQTRDPFLLAKKLNIIVLFDQLGEVGAFYTSFYNQKIAYLNSEMSRYHYPFLLSACIYFSLKNSENSIIYRKRKIDSATIPQHEKDSDLFAFELLEVRKKIINLNCIKEILIKDGLEEKINEIFEWLDNVVGSVETIEKVTNCHRINQILYFIKERTGEDN